MSGGNNANNPFSLGSTTGSEPTPGGFFALPTPWGQKVSEPTATGQQKEQANAAVFNSGASGTHPLFRTSIFGQATANENAQKLFGKTADVPARSFFAPTASDRVTETVSMGVQEARTESDSSTAFAAGGSNIFGKPEKPGIFRSHLEDNLKFVKPQTDVVPSLFSESLFGKAIEASKALPANEGPGKAGAGIFGKVAEQKKDVGIFGGTQPKTTTSISAGFFGKPLHSSSTMDGEKLNEALFGKPQTDTQPFGSIFARPQDAQKDKETIFGNKQDPPSIFGNANIFEKTREASAINVQKSDTNLFQTNTARDSPNIFGMASGSNIQKDEAGNIGGRNTDSRSSTISLFGGDAKPGYQAPHPRDPRTVRPGLFGHALGQALGSGQSPTKVSLKKTDSTSSVPPAEIQSLVSLYISDVPSEIFDKSLLLKHFSKFGTVTKIMLSNARKSCSVKFENHEAAEQARSNGTQIGNIRLHIFWSKSGSLGHGERRPLKVYQKETESRPSRSKAQRDTLPLKRQSLAQSKFGASGPSLYDLEDDVQAELNAMLLPNTSSFSSKLPPAPQPKENRSNKLLPRAVSTLARAKRRSSPLSLREAPPAKAATEEVPLSISNATLEELTKVMRSQAHSAEERYRVLEARDKMMRMKRVRQSDLAKARINRGTCPDMCPEKERYHREFQRQVAAYEVAGAPGKMDHRAAIKQYSRSSADQEEPLSHELRPASALRLTMDYLMWKLMDICDKKDESMADWYHYIWDRTRGIRKDITQQELSDASSVELVEQCARWHIFCSERLIAEDLMIYDDNINTENLTKCLQTLKYMYLDLSLKGVTCPNEAEFRAYFVMLNLNEGDCMWEVQQLSSEIRESEPVRFALQVSTALASNNYIRFFKLVRSTTYLNACILHRYFAQVRSQALQTMVKAFCSRAKETVFTLEDIVSLSGFENTQEAATLCAHHGLQLSEDRTSVVFSRNTFYLPDSALPATRVMSLVDAKRSCSVGAVVSGGGQPRTDFQAHVPHDSFDGNGMLKPGAWTAQDQETGDAIGTAEEESDSAVDYGVDDGEEQEALGSQDREEEDDGLYEEDGVDLMGEAIMQQMVDDNCEQTMNEVLEAVIEDEICSVVEAEMKNAFVDEATRGFADDIINVVTEEMISSICTEEVAAATAAKEEEIRQKRLEAEAEMLRKMREKRFLQELNNYLDEFALECAEQVMAEEQELEDWLTKSRDNIVEEFVQEECLLLARESIDSARLVEVNAMYERIQKRQLKDYFKQWQDFVVRSKMRKQSMADFPAWMSNLSLDEQAASLSQPDPYLIENMNRVRYASNKSKLHALEQEPPPVPKLDVATAISVHISARMREVGCHDAYLYWKLVSSGPDTQEAPRNSKIIARWENQIFSLDEKTSMRLSRITPNSYETLTVCVRSLTGHVDKGDVSQGANGILFWLSHKDTSFLDARKRLSRLLDTLRKVPAIPVAVVPTGEMSISNKEIHKELDLVLHREGMRVSYFKVFPRTSSSGHGLRRQVEEACQFLAEVASPPPPVVVLPMRQFTSRCLMDELWGVVKPTARTQDPNSMIELYNKTLHRVKDMLCDASLSEYSLGAQEFKKYLLGDSQHEQRQFHVAPAYWGSQEYHAFVSKMLSKAELPMIQPWPPANNGDLKEVIVQYCDSQGLPEVVSSLFLLIEQQARVRHRLSYPPAQPGNWKTFLKSISWSSVVETIVEAKLSALDYAFAPADGSELQVAVHLEGFKKLQTWLIEHLYILDLTEVNPDESCNDEKIGQKRSMEDDLPQPSKQRKLSLVEIYSNIKASLSRLDDTMSSVKTTWQDMDKDIAHKP